MKKFETIAAAIAAAAALTLAGNASAAAIISNGVITLGVDNEGQLNVPGGAPSPVTGTTAVGLRFNATGNEATAHGCFCEGWGVGIGGSGVGGSANNAQGVSEIGVISFTSTASTATSRVSVFGDALRVTHAYAPAAETPNLYRVTVTIENTSDADIANLLYRRTFDWDVEPTTFSELVTIGGSAGASAVLQATNDGFCSSSVFASCGTIGGAPAGDITDFGPLDHGANFDFDFGALADGASFTFEIFYGAALTEAGALGALAAVGAEVFSLGQCASDPRGVGANGCNTFVFGFKGVGGTPIDPNPIPVPAALPLFLAGLAGFGALRRRRAPA
jgi:type IV pilus assembly protein PilY1